MKNKLNLPTFDDYCKSRFTPEKIEEMTLSARIIGKIIITRKEKGLTQKELGKMVGMSQQSIARIESFECNPTLFTVEKIFNALGIDLSNFNGKFSLAYDTDDVGDKLEHLIVVYG